MNHTISSDSRSVQKLKHGQTPRMTLCRKVSTVYVDADCSALRFSEMVPENAYATFNFYGLQDSQNYMVLSRGSLSLETEDSSAVLFALGGLDLSSKKTSTVAKEWKLEDLVASFEAALEKVASGDVSESLQVELRLGVLGFHSLSSKALSIASLENFLALDPGEVGVDF